MASMELTLDHNSVRGIARVAVAAVLDVPARILADRPSNMDGS